MRVGVRDSLVQRVDEKPCRFKLILLFHTAVVGGILLIFGTPLLSHAGSRMLRESEASGTDWPRFNNKGGLLKCQQNERRSKPNCK
jgi:hypothetical protein